MDPLIPFSSVQPLYPSLFSGVFSSAQESNDYLSSLDSDTRDYVIKHTSDFNSKDELIKCVDELQGRR
ncbi:MAG TPA: hypothetical protein VJZ04_11990 [Lachnospiraceae bacterium]|nr:hypothetical protein [Lachnospiraceae bacterium]